MDATKTRLTKNSGFWLGVICLVSCIGLNSDVSVGQDKKQPASPATHPSIKRENPYLKKLAAASQLDLELMVISFSRTGKVIDASRAKYGDYGPILNIRAEYVEFKCKIRRVEKNSLKRDLKKGDQLILSYPFDLPLREKDLPLQRQQVFRAFVSASELQKAAKSKNAKPTARLMGSDFIMSAQIHLSE